MKVTLPVAMPRCPLTFVVSVFDWLYAERLNGNEDVSAIDDEFFTAVTLTVSAGAAL
jgi:hypothetical protein